MLMLLKPEMVTTLPVEVINIVSGWYQAQNINFKWKYQPDGSNKF